ncbi:MAG: hypothetical protein ACRCZP_08490 [Phycicoccus sp.]
MTTWSGLSPALAGAALLAWAAGCWTWQTLTTRTDLARSAAGCVLLATTLVASYVIGSLIALVLTWTADALTR